MKSPRFFRPLRGKRFIITSAQNATPVHQELFGALKKAAKHLDAELIVIPLRYKNPTSQWSQKQEEHEKWAPELAPYLHNVRKKLGPNIILAADVKTQLTASMPLSGFESLTGGESCILGHPKMQFRTIPVPTGKFPKILTTTGICTIPNYTDSKAGKIGAFHHHLGAVIVELRGKKFFLRQIHLDSDGSFIDLNKRYTSESVTTVSHSLALVMGDTHVRVADPGVDKATFGPKGIVETLNPQTLVFHDILDGESINPHEDGNPFSLEAKRRANRLSIQDEIQQVVEFLNKRVGNRQAIIVESNHHDFLTRWIQKTDWKHDLKNACFYLESAKIMLESAQMRHNGPAYIDPFVYWLQKLGCTKNVRCLEAGESFEIAGIELGMHGHRGPKGTRGSLKNLSRLGARVITGHSHSPGIEEGHYQVGTSSFRRLAYQKGPDSSLNTHCVVYANGKRSLLTIIGDEWR